MGEDGLTGLRTCLQGPEWNSVKSILGRGGKAAPQICDRQFRQNLRPRFPSHLPLVDAHPTRSFEGNPSYPTRKT